MANGVTVAISSDFLTAFAKLPRAIQGKTTEFVNKFRNDPNAPGINYEKLKKGIDKKIYSVRIDDTYRGIVARQPESGVYLLLWVDHHDEAYDWASRKRVDVNPSTGSVQVYDVQSTSETSPAVQNQALFAAYGDSDLKKIGVPADLIAHIKSIPDQAAFYNAADSIPKDAYEYLSWLVEGLPIEEVIELAVADQSEADDKQDLQQALNSPLSQKSFVVLEGEDELRKIMAEPLEKERILGGCKGSWWSRHRQNCSCYASRKVSRIQTR